MFEYLKFALLALPARDTKGNDPLTYSMYVNVQPIMKGFRKKTLSEIKMVIFFHQNNFPQY